jgi:glycosyltransferase involved in cell wall biosynthesis
MKILHINTSNAGGAATAAVRLHYGLLDAGIGSYFLFLNKEENINIKNAYQLPKFYPSVWQRIMDRIGFKKLNYKRRSKLYSNAKGNFDVISYPLSDYRVHRHHLYEAADIIHLHWIGDFVDFSSFFQYCKKPVVWTMHDKNPAMGCFHLSLDRLRENNLRDLDTKLSKRKSEILKTFKQLYLVSPSKALIKFSKESLSLHKFSHYHIYNSVDSNVFQDLSKFNVKQLLGLPQDKTIVLLFSYSLNIYHKGMSLFVESINNRTFSNLHFIIVGTEFNLKQTKNTFTSYPYIHDKLLLNIFYSTADLLLISSREENLPNVMLEAMACGTSVLAFPIGGMLDVIQTGFNGILTENISSEALITALVDLNCGKYNFNRKCIRDYAIQNFSLCNQASKYAQLYKKILSQKT